tara:strand:- start:992 stop:1183 length:192 start_codon:yes stop_codon:yes gene_type:complete
MSSLKIKNNRDILVSLSKDLKELKEAITQIKEEIIMIRETTTKKDNIVDKIPEEEKSSGWFFS